jgi:hypothetical protein
LNIGDVATLDKLCGATLQFGQTGEFEQAELTESVFWKPRNGTLELQDLQLQFGELRENLLTIEISALCFDHAKKDVKVLIRAQVKIGRAKHGK